MIIARIRLTLTVYQYLFTAQCIPVECLSKIIFILQKTIKEKRKARIGCSKTKISKVIELFFKKSVT